MNNKILILSVILLLLIGVILIPKGMRLYKIDTCLEKGGMWNHDCDTCEYLTNNISDMDMLQIIFGPSMHHPASILYNILDRSILFQVNHFSYEIPPPPEFKDNYYYVHSFIPKSRYFKIDTNDFNYIQDSIINKLTEKDLENRSRNVIDGIGAHMIFYLKNDSIIETSLVNNFTEKQHSLIVKLIDTCLKNEQDSTNIEYLTTLLECFE